MSIIKKLGSLFGSESEHKSAPRSSDVAAEKLAAAALMVEVAVQDGEFGGAEKQVIENLLVSKLELSHEDADELLNQAIEKQSESIQILSFTRDIKDHFDEDGRAHIMEMLWRVVFADGEEDNYEHNLMRRIAGLLYISDKKSGEIRKKVMHENNLT